MNELLPYFAIFYVGGLVLMGLFIRFVLFKRRMEKQSKNNEE
ncbi:MAG: hypothetical protein ACE5D0_00745 [Fidelibacterota bacterium]